MLCHRNFGKIYDMIDILYNTKSFLEKMNQTKDQFLFIFIKKYWPRIVTPNHLTYARIVIGVLLLILLFVFKKSNGFLIMPLLILGALTDLFDGAIARCFNMETKKGAMLDPVADRVLIIPIAIYTIMNYKFLLFSLIFLETINALISFFVQGKKIFFGSNIFGKTKMVLQSLVFVAILLLWPRNPNLFFILILWISAACFVVSIIFKIVEIKSYYGHKNI